MNIITELFKSLDNWGNHPAFIEVKPNNPAVYTTAEQFKNKIIKTAEYLKKSGIQKNYLVTLFLENSVDFLCIFFGLMYIGAKPIALKLDYRKIELDEIFDNAQPQAIITETHHLGIVNPYIKNKIVITRNNGKLKKYQSLKKKLKPAVIPADIASINYTYRGYGYPLGAMIPYNQYLHGAKVLQDGLQAHAKEKMLVILPMSHIFTLIGCVFVPILYKLTAVIANTMHPRRIFEIIKEFKINHITSIPEIYLLLSKFKDIAGKMPSLKVFVCGGSLLNKKDYYCIKKAFNVDLLHGYGLTEFTPASRNMRDHARAGTIGPLCDGIQCKIVSSHNNGSGEILIKTDKMFKGYYKRPKITKEAFEGTWFKTGDIGKIQNGHLIFEKEKKKTKKVNGNMVDLEEIRKLLPLTGNLKDIASPYKIAESKNLL